MIGLAVVLSHTCLPVSRSRVFGTQLSNPKQKELSSSWLRFLRSLSRNETKKNAFDPLQVEWLELPVALPNVEEFGRQYSSSA